MAARISVDTDTWWHLRAGAWMVEHGTILQQDIFSYTKYGSNWEYPGWLVEIPMYWIYQHLGPGGLNLFTALMVTSAFMFVWLSAQEGVFTRALVVVLAAATSGIYWAARPYLVTFVLSAMYLWVLNGYLQQPKGTFKNLLFVLPVLMVVWVNSHGGFAVGFLIFAIYYFAFIAECALKVERLPSSWKLVPLFDKDSVRSIVHLTMVGLLLVCAALLNPANYRMLFYPFQTIAIEALSEYIAEWQSPDFQTMAVQPFIWLGLLVLASVGFSSKKLRLHEFMLIAVFGYMGLTAVRNIALFALVAPPVIVPRLNADIKRFLEKVPFFELKLETQNRKLGILNWSIFFILGLAVVFKASLVFPVAENERYFREGLPVKAVEFLRVTSPQGRLFNSYNWGGYLIWELPAYPVFIDGRTDLYSGEIMEQWLQVVRAEDGWEEVLRRWEVGVILVEADMPLVKELEGTEWQLVYQDDLAVIFIKPVE